MHNYLFSMFFTRFILILSFIYSSVCQGHNPILFNITDECINIQLSDYNILNGSFHLEINSTCDEYTYYIPIGWEAQEVKSDSIKYVFIDNLSSSEPARYNQITTFKIDKSSKYTADIAAKNIKPFTNCDSNVVVKFVMNQIKRANNDTNPVISKLDQYIYINTDIFLENSRQLILEVPARIKR